MDRIKVVNARIITPYRVIEDGSIIIENGRIAKVSGIDYPAVDCQMIDAKGNFAAPGFIDIHTHGSGGYDFMDGTAEAFMGAAEQNVRHGTTSMLPTTVASTYEGLKNTFEVFAKVRKQNTKGSDFIGLHLEGPYISIEQKGAQDPRYIRNPNPEEYNGILDLSDDIKRWSIAPELDGAFKLGRLLRGKGILPSIAHSDATYEIVQEAFENGFTHITHLYSCTSGVKRINSFRYAGVIESAFLIDDMSVEIIADGMHLPASLLKLIYKIKGPSKTVLVTDSMRAAGMPEGESILGSIHDGQKVIVEDGVAKLMDRSAFAGSVATSDILVRTMIKLACVPVIDAVRMMTATPAGIIGMDASIGSIAEGKDADIVIFDDDINIKMSIVKGRTLYNNM